MNSHDVMLPIWETVNLHNLRAAIRASENSGLGIDAEQVFNRLESKYKLTASAVEAQQCGFLPSPRALTPPSPARRKG